MSSTRLFAIVLVALLAGSSATAAPAAIATRAPLLMGSDNCATPDPIAGTGTFAFDTTLATTGTQGQAEPLCLAFGTTVIANDVWFVWTAPTTGTFQIDTCGVTTVDTRIAVYAGSACPGGPALACNDDFCGFQSRVIVAAVAGNPYVIQVGSFPGTPGGSGSFVVTAVNCAPTGTAPSNDACSGASTVTSSVEVNTMDATSSASVGGGGGCSALVYDVWYAWMPAMSGEYEISMCPGTFTPTVNVYGASATCTSLGTPIACGEPCSGDASSELCLDVIGGQTYFIQIGAVAGAMTGEQGCATLDITMLDCNDKCYRPETIVPSGSIVMNTVKAKTSHQGQMETQCGFGGGSTAIENDHWYTFTAPFTGSASVSTCGSSPAIDTRIAVYDGAGCPAASAIACDDDACGPMSFVCFAIVAGNDYTIQVGLAPGATGGLITLDVRLFASAGCAVPGTAYCAGDGVDPNVTTPCPCANFGAAGNGCASSFNAAGAHLDAHGNVPLDDAVLDASGMNATGTCLFIKGDVDAPGGIVFGDGVRCFTGALIRLRATSLVAGAASFPAPSDTVTLSVRGATAVGSGLTAYYGAYYRNAAAAFCPPATFNVSNGYRVTW